MKDKKIISIVFIVFGILLIIVNSIIIQNATDIVVAVLGINFLMAGTGFLCLGLLILIVPYLIFYYRLLVSERSKPASSQAVINRTRTPIIAGILYVIIGILYLCYYLFYINRADIVFNFLIYDTESSGLLISLFLIYIPFSVSILAGICLLIRRFWWFSLIGAIMLFIPGIYHSAVLFINYAFIGFAMSTIFILLPVLLLLMVLVLKKEIMQKEKVELSAF
jgi:hypothetical protein